MSRPGRLLVRAAAALCLVAASCSGDDRPTTTHAVNTSSTLPPSGTTAAGVGGEAQGPSALRTSLPVATSGKPGGSQSSGPSSTPTTGPIGGQHNTTGTTTGSPATTLPPGLPPEKCPDAKTCRRYVFGANMSAAAAPRWAKGPDGFATVRYHVNPTGSGLPDEQVRGAAEAAFATVMKAAPTLRIEFAGFTSRAPVPGDGFTVIGFVNASAGHAIPTGRDGVLVEADMLLAAGLGSWTWEPCEQRDNSCTLICVHTPDGNGCRGELQNVMTHEGMHWFWLGDMTDDETDRELTMSPRFPTHDRFRSTLALGDVLGLRALYPCSCPLPPIYSP